MSKLDAHEIPAGGPLDDSVLETIFGALPAGVAVLRGPTHVYDRINDSYWQVVGKRDILGRPVAEALPEVVGQGYIELLDEVYATGVPYVGRGTPIMIDRVGDGVPRLAHLNFAYMPIRNAEGNIHGILIHADDVSELMEGRAEVERLAAQLQDERQRLETIVDRMPAGVVIGDAATGELTLVNREYREFFGASPDHDHDDGYSAFAARTLDGRLLEHDDYPLARTIASGETVIGEQYEFDRIDGERRILELNAAPIHDADGAITAGVSTFFDVTERRRSEQLLAAHQRMLGRVAAGVSLDETLETATQLVERQSPVEAMCSILLVDDAGTLRLGSAPSLPDAYNRAIDGLHVGPLAGSCGTAAHTGEMVIARDVRVDPRWADYHELAVSHGLFSCWSIPIKDTDGTVYGTFATYYRVPRDPERHELDLVRLAAGTAAIAIQRDRLERQRADALVLEREARAQAEARAHAAVSLEFVADGVALVDPEGIVRIWNPAAAAMLDRAPEQVIGRSIVDVLPGWGALIERVVPEESRPRAVPLFIDDAELWLSMTAAPSPVGTVYAFRDVTADQRLEKMRSDLVATVSHELRTPLAAVYGAALTLQSVELTSANAAMLVDMVATESDRLRLLLDDILLASKLEAGGHLTTESQPFDLSELVRATVTAYPSEADDIVVDAPSTPVLAAADEARVRQVLINLVDNARKYGASDRPVEVTVADGHDDVRVSVADHGAGIPRGELERVFEKFYRLDPNLRQGVGGTGLGLYICRGLVERMGGDLTVTSSIGHGSTFTFTLPRG